MNKKIISLVLILSIAFSSGIVTFAADSIVTNSKEISQLQMKSLSIPDEAKEYAESIVVPLLSSMIGNEMFYGVEINSYEDLMMGQPYTIISDDSDADTYYFPIIEKGNIKLILSVIYKNGTWNAALGKDIAEQLNNLIIKTNKEPYILYTANGILYAENESNTIEIQDTKLGTENLKFSIEQLSYHEKIVQYSNLKQGLLVTTDILIEENDMKEIGANALELSENIEYKNLNSLSLLSAGIGRFASDPFSINTSTAKILNTTNCLVNQKDKNGVGRGMCWAACVANIVRYYNGVNNVYAYDVCDKMSIDYDMGGSIQEMKLALSKYSITYTASTSTRSYSQIKSNITNKRPIIMCATASVGGHAVTIIGYSEASGTEMFNIWNSGSETGQICTFSSGPVFSSFTYAGYTFYWKETVY